MSDSKRQESLVAEYGPSKVRFETGWIIVLACVAGLSVLSAGMGRFFETFQVDGVHWSLNVQPAHVTAQGFVLYGASGPVAAEPLQGTARVIDVVLPNLNVGTQILLGASIVVGAAAILFGIACIALLARQVRRDQYFTLASARILQMLMRGGVLGGVVSYALWGIAGWAIAGSLSVGSTDSGSPESQGFWVFLLVLAALALIDITLRRAIRLQRETEGLV